ncbi:MAG: hypothetical protein GEU86_21160 [Actinophytocola sp.]|nr:hypothetical protein [Actinophytocola sp.]
MARRQRQQPESLSARDRARIQAAVATALATVDRAPRGRGELVVADRRLPALSGARPEIPDDPRRQQRRDRHGRPRDSDRLTVGEGLRSLAHRNQRQLYPWLVMLLVAASGYAAALVGWAAGHDFLVGWIATGLSATAVTSVVITVAVRKTHPYWAGWLTVCAVNAVAWISVTAFHGFDYSHLVWLYGSTCLLGLRWWRHVRHPHPTGPAGTDREPVAGARLMEDWASNAGCPGGPVAGARLANVTPYKHGFTGEVQLVRGKQSLSDIQTVLPRLSTALDVAQEHLIVEAHPDGPPSRLRIQVVTKSPVSTAVYFDQPVYRDGRILLGPYADGIGEATFVLYTDDSMESGYVLGSKGSGKSRVLETVALTAIACTPTVVFYIDGQNGASSPLLWEHALWHAGPDDAPQMLRSLLSIKDYRQLYNRKHKLTGFTPGPELPGILVIVDECHKIFTEQTSARWADLAREGRKLGMGILGASQVTTLDAFGGGQHADALRSSLVSSNGIALRTASKVQSSVFPGLSVDLMALPKLPGFGYTVDDGDDQHRTAPFRNRWLIGDRQAAQLDEPLPDGVFTAEAWFDHVARNQQLDQRSAHAAGRAFADRYARAEREQAELDALFAEDPTASAVGRTDGACPDIVRGNAGESGAVVVPFPQLPELAPFEPSSSADDANEDRDEPAGRVPAPSGLTDAQYRVWDALNCGLGGTSEVAEALGISDRRVRVLVAELDSAGHVARTGRGQYVTTVAEDRESNA